MDDLLREFLTETTESLDVIDVELVRFEQDPNNDKILGNIFRLVHTIKGTCGFLGLPRLEALAHAAETLMGKYRDGMAVTEQGVTLILQTIDRIKSILGELEASEAEPAGVDSDLISQLEYLSVHGPAIESAPATAPEPEPEPVAAAPVAPPRVMRPGEVSEDELERAFRETAVEIEFTAPAPAPKVEAPPAPKAEAKAPAKSEAKPAAVAAVVKSAADEDHGEGGMKGGQTLRVNVETLEHLMTMVSELVLTRNQLLEIVRRHEDSEFKVPLQRLSNVTAELQEGVMKTRMQPIGNAWQKLPRIVRDLANETGKSIELEMHGAETELDRQVLDLIKDPLTHMVRNSADHGLERPEDRRLAGKPDKGTIRLSAYHEGGHIIIAIADDGRGLNTDRIKKKAIDSGIVSEAEAEKLTEAQIHKFIFAAGFSTAAAITSISGRGVGMDVVRTNIDQIGGTIDLKSVPGEGSTFTIKIPLTLAIVSALIVECADNRYAIPQLSVIELVRAQQNSEHRIERINDTPVLRLRNKLLPLIHLRKMLHAEGGQPVDEENGFIVVTQVGSQVFGIVVDSVFHTEEIVVKPMSSKLRHIALFSGNTILGDGSVIMIIDPNGIATSVGTGVAVAATATEIETESRRDNSQETMSMIVFRAGSMEPKAIPLSLVTRLEEVPATQIEYSNGRYLVQYRGQLMPLVLANHAVEVRREGAQPLLVFADAGRSMGLVVDEIVDIVEDRLNIEVSSETPGILGSAVIKGQATEMIDIGYYLPLAFEDWFKRKEMAEEALTKRLLFVDDSPFFRNMLTPVLKAAGYEVTTCERAQNALDILKEGGRYDVVVSDIEMPDMNGFELAEALRADHRLAALPVIALSSLTSPASVERARQAGFHDYVAKFDRQGLIAALKDSANDSSYAA